jgi:hypothetical protein
MWRVLRNAPALLQLLRLHRQVQRALRHDSLAQVLAAFPGCTVGAEQNAASVRDVELFTRWLRRLAPRLSTQRSVCLDQAIALRAFFAQRGVDVALKIGVKRAPFAAHAWLEVAGIAILERADVQQEFHCFQPLPEGTMAQLMKPVSKP